MAYSKIQTAVLELFKTNELLQKSREHLSLTDKRLLLHEQFMEFMDKIPFKVDYKKV